MVLTCPQCGEELVTDVRNLWIFPKVWTDYICPECAKRYSATDLVKAIRAKRRVTQ
jgi:DNA-directed RNA polymerase subunit RPC12/RpoP